MSVLSDHFNGNVPGDINKSADSVEVSEAGEKASQVEDTRSEAKEIFVHPANEELDAKKRTPMEIFGAVLAGGLGDIDPNLIRRLIDSSSK